MRKASGQCFAPDLTAEQEEAISQEYLNLWGQEYLHMHMFTIMNCVRKNPWLTLKYPQFLLEVARGQPTDLCFMHLLCDKDYLIEAFRVALGTRESREALRIKDRLGRTALHCLAAHHPVLLMELMEKNMIDDDMFVTPDKYGDILLHAAAGSSQDSVACCKQIMEKAPDSIFFKSEEAEITVFEYLMDRQYMTTNQKLEILEQAATIEGFVRLVTHIEREDSGVPAVEARIRELTQKKLPVGQPVQLSASEPERQCDALDLARPHPAVSIAMPAGQSAAQNVFPELDLAHPPRQYESLKLLETARTIIQKTGVIGVHGKFEGFACESPDQLHTLGDESASIHLMRYLVALGAKDIQLRLSAPNLNPHTYGVRMLLNTDKEKEERSQRDKLKKREEVILAKLALLLSDTQFDPKNGLPQEVCLDGCRITIIPHDHAIKKNIQLELGFTIYPYVQQFLSETGDSEYWYPDNYLSIMPYRFSRGTSILFSGIQDGYSDRVPLNLPPNTIIPAKMSDALNTMEEGVDGDYFVSVQNMMSLCREAHIDTGVIYGIHHRSVHYHQEKLLNQWIAALKHKKNPTVLFIHASRLFAKVKENLEKEANIHFFGITCALDVTKVSNSHVSVCLIPNLSQTVFHSLLDQSNIPTLVEGANTTSYLLETGHPYLSLLPKGKTPIPYEMGNPLEALKLEAFSFKLNGCRDSDLKTMREMWGKVMADDFHGALMTLSNEIAKPNFLDGKKNCVDAEGAKIVTVQSLLEKGRDGSLKSAEKEALLSALDTSTAAMESYIAACMDKTSKTRAHFNMQMHHVNQPFSNTVLMSLYRFAEAKKLAV
ncbi:hypothetical protein [Parendozoicomonas sp. Alg238-R29]|uniref:hypothetical protein n=1 Tax=Parendozoicomonas sp. Alg238-R29 TaxID=2993446 RepID=UPI00248E86B6|nr:hypothetical protein [Parendozoicomonas sp. Alg238-R29]